MEAGYAIGEGKPVYIIADNGDPELMNKMADEIFPSVTELIDFLKTEYPI